MTDTENNSENVSIKTINGNAFARFTVHGYIVHIDSNPERLWFYDTQGSIENVRDVIGIRIIGKCVMCGK